MAQSILKIIDRGGYKEVIVNDSTLKQDFIFNRKDSYKDEAELLTWAAGLISKITSDKAAIDQEISDVKGEFSKAEFIQWIKDNKTRPDVLPLLYKLAEMYKLEN